MEQRQIFVPVAFPWSHETDDWDPFTAQVYPQPPTEAHAIEYKSPLTSLLPLTFALLRLVKYVQAFMVEREAFCRKRNQFCKQTYRSGGFLGLRCFEWLCLNRKEC
ncbi:hypothetical protein RRG08_018023 [Elysia crispata]|uniref:Uncharacterized protein n=1 Tax=Elysia crispata TaxID=231223 RepID=A0AAE0ZD37_9GAST|nr:hypothetical protein RRG08_018023 [Elysia crispata]